MRFLRSTPPAGSAGPGSCQAACRALLLPEEHLKIYEKQAAVLSAGCVVVHWKPIGPWPGLEGMCHLCQFLGGWLCPAGLSTASVMQGWPHSCLRAVAATTTLMALLQPLITLLTSVLHGGLRLCIPLLTVGNQERA